MTTYWVIGGTYASTDFRELAPGAMEIRLGPFATYAEAERAWAAQSWRTVDECNTRFAIVAAEDGEQPALPRGSALEKARFPRP